MKKRKAVKRDKGKYYMLGLLALCLLIGAALAAPQLIFGIQDTLLCREIMLQEQEAMDVAALSTNYERSLYQRMANFAEGIAQEDKFYVDERELEVTDEITDILFSSEGLFQNEVLLLRNAGMLSEELLLNSSIEQYKQYVVYNDNYAEGVNFILWFFELEDKKGERLYLLMDAQDHTIYGLKTLGNKLVYRGADDYYNFLEFWASPNIVWLLFCNYYEVFEKEDIENILESYMDAYGYVIYDAELQERVSVEKNSAVIIKNIWERDIWSAISDEIGLKMYEEGVSGGYYQLEEKELCLTMAYRENVLSFEIYLLGEIEGLKNIIFPDVEIGVYELYQLIPEFRA